jgi:ATP synthase protein I
VNKELRYLLKRVIPFNLVIGIIIVLLSQIIFKQYSIVVMIGVIVACIGFLISIITTNFLSSRLKGITALVYVISFFGKITLVSIIGLILFRDNKYYIYAYMVGYVIQIISILIYCIKLNRA